MPATSAPTVPRDLQRAIDAHRRGALPDAATGYRRFLARHPRNPQVWDLYAMTLRSLGRDDEAVTALQRAVRLDPRDADRQRELLTALQAAGRSTDALDAARAALMDVAPTAPLLVAAARAALAAAADDDAVAWTRQALVAQPDCVDAMALQAIGLRRQDRYPEALRLLDRAITLNPDHAIAHYEAGLARYELGETTEPLRMVRRAVALAPSSAAFRSGEGMILTRLGRFEEAVTAYDDARRLTPDDRLLEANQSWPLLGAGRFSRGWRQYETLFDAGARRPNRHFGVPRWDGGPQPGRLLVWREQGIGDEIRCASMIPDTLALADDVVVECEPRLVSLLRRSFPGVDVRAEQSGAIPDFDVHCPMHSLPAHVRPDVDSYRRQGPYLVPDAALVAKFAELVSDDGRLNVGVSWRSMALATKRLSHYTVLDEWGPILQTDGIRFWNLQYGGSELLETERAAVRERFGVDIEVIEGLDYTDDMESLAALITNLDVVVSVGTAVACLAGAVGAPVLLLSVDFDPFRFGQPDYPWFRGTQVMARHPEAPWAPVMERTAERLTTLRDDRR